VIRIDDLWANKTKSTAKNRADHSDTMPGERDRINPPRTQHTTALPAASRQIEGELIMLSRRQLLAQSVSATAAAIVGFQPSPANSAPADDPRGLTPDGTWLTYAVNVEMTWPNVPFLDKLRKVKEAGFSHYEFWPWRGKDIDGILRLNQELGLTTAQFSASPVKGFGHGITNPDPTRLQEFEEEIKTAVEVAKKLSVKKICVVAGEETKGYSRAEQTKAVIHCLKAGARIVEPEGITIILEPLNILVDHPRQLIVTSAQGAEVLEAVGSPNVKMLFDIYHQQISEGNLSGNIRKYRNLIGYFQLADHPGRHEPKTGEINYAHVLRTIHALGYRDPIGMEMTPKGDPIAAFRALRQVDAEAKSGAGLSWRNTSRTESVG
jgi:hydroxypyruvate isomerase